MSIIAQEVVKARHGDWYGHYGLIACPICQTEGRRDQRGLAIRQDGTRVLTFCHKSGCDFRDISAALELPFEPEQPTGSAFKAQPINMKTKAEAIALWSQSKSIEGTIGQDYLKARGIEGHYPMLRFVPAIWHAPSKRSLPAIVSRFEPTHGVHRTYLDPSDLSRAYDKMMLGPCRGGFVSLTDGRTARNALIVGEGMENCASLLEGLVRFPADVWSCANTSLLQSVSVPTRIWSKIILAGDSDVAGVKAMQRAAQRLRREGHSVWFMVPPEGKDWNDILRTNKHFCPAIWSWSKFFDAWPDRA